MARRKTANRPPIPVDSIRHDDKRAKIPYVPGFLVRIDGGRGSEDLLSLTLEVSGAFRRDKEVKVATMRSLWIPAVNNHGGFGRWNCIEIKDPWNARNEIRANVGGESFPAY